MHYYSFHFFERSVSENIIESKGIIATIGFILTLLEFPKIFSTVWKKFLERMIDDKLDGDGEKMICSIVSIIALLLVFTYINMIIIDTLNETLDTSKPVKKYVAVTKKYYKVMSRSKDNPRTNSYYIELTSWLSNNKFTLHISHKEYEATAINDVYEAITKSGFFGFGYYNSIHKIDKSIFPDGTKFPIDEYQAQKLIVEKNNN